MFSFIGGLALGIVLVAVVVLMFAFLALQSFWNMF
jgi:hypothetical protein